MDKHASLSRAARPPVRWRDRLGLRFTAFLLVLSAPALMLVEIVVLSFEYREVKSALDRGALSAPAAQAHSALSPYIASDTTEQLALRLKVLRHELEDPRSSFLGAGGYALLELSDQPIRLSLRCAQCGGPLLEPKILESSNDQPAKVWTEHIRFENGAELLLSASLTAPWRRLWSAFSFEWPIMVASVALLALASVLFLQRYVLVRLRNMANAAANWSTAQFSKPLLDNKADEIGILARQLNGMAIELRGKFDSERELATLQERERLSQELHDSVKQQCFALELQLAALTAATARSLQASMSAELRTAASHDAANALAEASNICTELRRDLDLVLNRLRASSSGRFQDELVRRIETFARRSHIAANLVGQLDHEPDPDAKTELLRIVDEALSNVLRHSKAETLTLSLSQLAERCLLTIEDNGVGFRLTATADTSASSIGMGLGNLQQRAQRLRGGLLRIDSSLGKGTRLELRWHRSVY